MSSPTPTLSSEYSNFARGLAGSSSRKLVKPRAAGEKHLDLIRRNQIHKRFEAIRGIMEHTGIFREPRTTEEWQQVSQTYATLLELSRDCYSSPLKSAATSLIHDIIHIAGPGSSADGERQLSLKNDTLNLLETNKASPMHVHLVALLSKFHNTEQHESDSSGSALSRVLNNQNSGTPWNQYKGGPRTEVDMLILGAPKAGKSTLLKRIHAAVNQDVTGFEYYRERLINDVVESMKTIIREREAEELAMPSDLPRSILLADAELTILTLPANLLHVLIHSGPLLPFKMEDASRAIGILWNAPAIRRIVRRLEARRCLMSNATYFFESTDRVFKPDYIPTGEDILRYQQSSVVCGSILKSGSATCRLIEVPWKQSALSLMDGRHRYGRPEVILFVAALSDYNQSVYGSGMTVMDESLASFEATVNSLRLTNTLTVLVFSKHEKFAEELTYLPLKCWRHAYQGHTCEEACRFIEKQYVDLVKDKDRLVMTHHLRSSHGPPSMLGLINAIQVKIAERWENMTGSLGWC